MIIDRGRKNNEILKQGIHKPLSVGEQCAILFFSMNGFLDNYDIKDVQKCEENFLRMMNIEHKGLLEKLSNGEWDDKIQSDLKSVCEKFIKK